MVEEMLVALVHPRQRPQRQERWILTVELFGHPALSVSVIGDDARSRARSTSTCAKSQDRQDPRQAFHRLQRGHTALKEAWHLKLEKGRMLFDVAQVVRERLHWSWNVGESRHALARQRHPGYPWGCTTDACPADTEDPSFRRKLPSRDWERQLGELERPLEVSSTNLCYSHQQNPR